MMRLKLVEDITNKIEYKSISDIDKFKKYADEILGGYGGMSDSDILRDIEEIYIDGELKGYIGLSKYNEEDGTKLLGIGNFMIIERGKGYGTKVINDIVSKYKSKYDLIYCFVDSDNEGAISLYKKLGKVYDQDGPNDNDQYYVTFYDNGKYKLEEALTEDLNSMLPYYKNLQDEDKTYILSFLSKDPTWNEKKESGQYSKWILDKLNRKIIDKSILGHLSDLLKRFEDNKKQLKDKDINKFKSINDLEDYLNNDDNYNDLSHRLEVRLRLKDRHNVDLSKEAKLIYEDNDWEVWVPETYPASCKLGQGTTWCTASTETSDYFNEYNDKGRLYININKHNPKEKYQFHFESDSFMDKDDRKIDIEEFFIANPTLYKKVYKDMYLFNIDNVMKQLSELKKNNYTYYYNGDKITKSIRSIIKNLIITGDVTSIGDEMFRNCKLLQTITFEENSQLTNIGNFAFYGCTSLKNIVIPNNVKSIGYGAFRNCDSLTSVVIGDNVESIGDSAFFYCTSLESIEIPSSVKSINDGAFYYCTSLTRIEIPNSVESIGYEAFSGCKSLTIYCEATTKPNGWDTDWNGSNCPVVWGYKGNKTNESFQELMNTKCKLEEDYDKKNLNTVETPEQLMDWMEENITYELANDEYGVEDDPPTKTAEEVIQSGTGHCAEQSYLEYKVLDELGYFPQLIFVKENNSEDDYGADGSAHMFVVYQDDDEKYTYFEHSQEHNKGIHKFDSISELFDFVGKNWWRYDANSDILEVRYIDEPITGINNWELAKECHRYPVDEILDISNNIMEEDVPLDAKWDPYKHEIIEESLTEAKKRKKKRKNQTQNSPVFKSVDDLKKWVKKRLKGLSPFTYLNPNAGNVEYNQSMFNQMMGSADGASSLGVSDGGISNGGLSAPAGDGGGMAMGEALDWDNGEKRYIETSSLDLIETYRNLLDEHLDKFIGELFHIADEKVYLNIIKMLRDSDIELPTAQQVLDAMIEMGYATKNSFVVYNLLVKDLGKY